jgi:NADH dehydrogenase
LHADGLDGVAVFRADVRDPNSHIAALAGADAVVNAVSGCIEKGGVTFEAVLVQGAEAVARKAAEAGVARLPHLRNRRRSEVHLA